MTDSDPPVAIDATPRPNLHKVAVAQKLIIYALLVQIVLQAALILLPSEDDPMVVLMIVLMLGNLLAILAGVAAVAVLASATGSSVLSSVVRGICLFIPFIGLLVLVATNMRATRILREGGVKVGFLGASANEVWRLKASTHPTA